MGAEELNIKDRIWMSEMDYSVLKEKMKKNECGWSYSVHVMWADAYVKEPNQCGCKMAKLPKDPNQCGCKMAKLPFVF
jgi:hypothetical protein